MTSGGGGRRLQADHAGLCLYIVVRYIRHLIVNFGCVYLLYTCNGAIVFFCRLYPSPSSHHGSVCVLPLISLLLNLHCIAGAGLPNHRIGEVS
jgi:hypothetical protein